MTQARDVAIAELAGGQRTIVAHEQLVILGCSHRAIAHWVSRGRFRSVFHGVYSVIRGDLPPLAREQAALLALGEHAFLSHRTAAAIWGLVRALPRQVELSVVGRHCRSRKGIHVHRIKAIDLTEVQQQEGLWVSAPARAVLELAATAPAKDVANAIDEGLAHGRVTPASSGRCSRATDRAGAPP